MELIKLATQEMGRDGIPKRSTSALRVRWCTRKNALRGGNCLKNPMATVMGTACSRCCSACRRHAGKREWVDAPNHLKVALSEPNAPATPPQIAPDRSREDKLARDSRPRTIRELLRDRHFEVTKSMASTIDQLATKKAA